MTASMLRPRGTGTLGCKRIDERASTKGTRMATTDIARFPWTGIDPAEWLRCWQQVWRLAPENLVQPILPGWTFNINSSNSSSPHTEMEVVARHSYGRQLGRMAEALAALIVETHGEKPAGKCYAEFLAMKDDIDRVKQKGAAARVERFKHDLEVLKKNNPPEYERLRRALRAALDA